MSPTFILFWVVCLYIYVVLGQHFAGISGRQQRAPSVVQDSALAGAGFCFAVVPSRRDSWIMDGGGGISGTYMVFLLYG